MRQVRRTAGAARRVARVSEVNGRGDWIRTSDPLRPRQAEIAGADQAVSPSADREIGPTANTAHDARSRSVSPTLDGDWPDARPRPRPSDLRDEDWYRFCREIDDLYASGRYEWAASTLFDIQGTVERTQRVTDGQRRAVRNIEEAGERQRPYGFRRRYEGYRGHWR
jgi:hypothetical protein